MHTVEELERIGIVPWEWMADGFDNSDILLGNGFSINLCERLNYRSLYNSFIQNCSDPLTRLFQGQRTTNFELIMQVLANAEIVNSVLDLETDRVSEMQIELREGLIRTIQDNHPTHDEIYYPQLISLSQELTDFRDIYTTNYDVYTYKIILQAITESRLRNEEDPYQDHFYDEMSPTQLAFLYDKALNEARTVYYLHGALFIYRQRGRVYKLRRLEQLGLEYIQLIRREIENNNLPVFVSEGTSRDKVRSINSDNYLTFCSRNLSNITRNLVAYGFSFSEQDEHISQMINRSRCSRIAISIYVGNKSIEELQAINTRMQGLFPEKEVVLYNSNSLFDSFDMIPK